MNTKTTVITLACAVSAVVVITMYRQKAPTTVGLTAAINASPNRNPQLPSLSALADTHASESTQHPLSTQETLKVIQNGLHSLEAEDHKACARLAKAGKAAMDSFLQGWSPIGRTAPELKALLGAPKEESNDTLLYAFDNGSWAWLYQFEMRGGRIVALTRPKSE